MEDQFEQLRTAVNQADSLTDSAKNDLLKLIADVETKAAEAAPEPAAPAPADDIPAVTQTARALGRLAGAVDGWEASHPQITALVNRIATTLSDNGI